MARKKLLWQIYPLYLFLIIASLVAVSFYASYQMKRVYHEEIASELEARAYLIEDQISAILEERNYERVDFLSKELGRRSKMRITIVDVDGRVLGDSEGDPAGMESHGRRPEIAVAFHDSVGTAIRYSNTLQRDMMYVAIPLKNDGRIIGVLRTSLPMTAIQRALTSINSRIAVSGVVIIILATLASLVIFRRVSGPLHRLREGAQRFARGDFQANLAVSDSEEIGSLAEAMNDMAAQLDQRIMTIEAQRSEQEAVLSSMIEGVLAVDSGERLLNINRAAAGIFGIDPEWACGRTVQEAIRNVDVQKFIGRALAGSEPIETEIAIYGDRERTLKAHGTVLQNAESEKVGAVVVLYDMTKIKMLESIRRDFVANVSHELKTPITAIKGFVETLRGNEVSPDDTKRFLEIVNKHADRLNTIVDDLLLLSRIEKEADKGEIKLTTEKINPVIESARQTCEMQAAAKNIRIIQNDDIDLKAAINSHQLEQALINLIDNAIKYSPPESEILIDARQVDNEIRITVHDRGCGIDGSHLPRLFERFYRVDKARSKELGGTGLGLAIVKHIALAHRGRVGVESTPGKGSAFTIYMPTIS